MMMVHIDMYNLSYFKLKKQIPEEVGFNKIVVGWIGKQLHIRLDLDEERP